MKKNLIVVDDFYSNPDDVRNYALTLPFTTKGNYPGYRTDPQTNQGVLDSIESILGQSVINWHTELSGSFQSCSSTHRSWIHSDSNNDYAAIVYLTPDAPLGSGTSFYKHKETETFSCETELHPDIPGSHYQDQYKWELVDKVANIYNRLVIFNGNLWHVSDPYFGDTLENSRLFHLFFMDVE